jgi:hypothetical protein
METGEEFGNERLAGIVRAMRYQKVETTSTGLSMPFTTTTRGNGLTV